MRRVPIGWSLSASFCRPSKKTQTSSSQWERASYASRQTSAPRLGGDLLIISHSILDLFSLLDFFDRHQKCPRAEGALVDGAQNQHHRRGAQQCAARQSALERGAQGERAEE